MNYKYIFDMLYESNLNSDIKLIINEKEYDLHTKLIIKSEFFKCLINNSQMNIINPIIIIGINNKNIESKFIDNIIEWFYHNDIKFLDKLLGVIDLNFDFKCLLEYYYICDYLQIIELLDYLKLKMKNYFDMIYNISPFLEDILLKNYGMTLYSFKKDTKSINVEEIKNFIFVIKKILNKTGKSIFKLFIFEKKIYDKIFIKFIEKIYKYDNIDELFSYMYVKYYDKKKLGIIIKNMMIYLNNMIEKENEFNLLYIKLLNIGFYDFKKLLKKNDKINNSCLIRLLDFNELIMNNKIINEKTKELEKLCKIYDIYDEFFLKMKFFFEYYIKNLFN